MVSISQFALKIFLILFLVKYSSADFPLCRVEINKLMKGAGDFSTWPLVLNPYQEKFFDVSAGVIQLKRGEMLRLACSGTGNYIVNVPNKPQTVALICLENQNFLYGLAKFNFYDFACAKVTIKNLEYVKNEY